MLCLQLTSVSLLLALVNGQIDSPSFPIDAPTAHPLASKDSVNALPSIESVLLAQKSQQARTVDLIDLDQFTIAEIEDTVELSKPDNVDNDAIQELIDQFLNKGTLEQDKNKKINTDVQHLINSSSYWNTSDLKQKHSIKDEKEVVEWLEGYDKESIKVMHQVAIAAWKLFTSASPITKQYLNEAEDVARAFLKASAKQAMQFDLESMQSPIVRKQLEVISKEGMNVLDVKSLSEYNSLLGSINRIYTNVDVCESSKQKLCIQKYSDLVSTIQANTDSDEALKLWKSWRSTVGQNLTTIYDKLMKVTNKAAKLNGYKNAGEMWQSALYQTKGDKGQKSFDIVSEVETIYTKILPFYTQLHAYFRHQLSAFYRSDQNLDRDSPIPAHLLRSSTGDDWSINYDETKPFEKMDKLGEEVADNLHKQNKNARSMFAKVFRYMKYLGFDQLPDSFWTKSVFSRIWSKDMICNPATAYDMMNDTDYRIKICAQLSQPDFVLAHKLFVQLYYKYYSSDKPFVLRDAPTPTISSAVAGAFGILATNIDYLKSQHLVSLDTQIEKSNQIDMLYKEALSEIVKIPFALVADKWRYKVFEGELDSGNWSKEWWNLREKYQGIKAPKGVEEGKYDAVVSAEISQQHAPASRHIAQYIVQFQILKAICKGSKFPLSESCVANKEVVKKIIDVMKKGGTISWLDALEEITGERKLDPAPLLEYYKPLINWLSTTNEQDNVFFGWDGEGEKFKDDEIPKARMENGISKSSIPSDDQIAYPGNSCSHGQECLLDSTCNGTICLCNEGLYTLHIGDTYNCVPENPAKAGFGDGSSIVIAITPNNQTSDDNSTSTETVSNSKAMMPNDSLSKVKLKTSLSSNSLPSSILISSVCLILFHLGA